MFFGQESSLYFTIGTALIACPFAIVRFYSLNGRIVIYRQTFILSLFPTIAGRQGEETAEMFHFVILGRGPRLVTILNCLALSVSNFARLRNNLRCFLAGNLAEINYWRKPIFSWWFIFKTVTKILNLKKLKDWIALK